jgi:hypothetical protein
MAMAMSMSMGKVAATTEFGDARTGNFKRPAIMRTRSMSLRRLEEVNHEDPCRCGLESRCPADH